MQHLKLGGANDTLKAWNFDVKQSPMLVKARVLDAPGLEFSEYVAHSVCTFHN